MIKHMVTNCMWRSGMLQADKWIENCLSYTGIRNMVEYDGM